mmetsp:Transcript_39575/g.60496  ORF Transcript_39575/g.60496 Transcript_39575/m.60496 type:complete len:135 (+) Transcript_39575:869-1273(+)
MTAPTAFKWGFGSEKRKGTVHRDAERIPGAGNYPIPSKMSEGPKYGMGIRLESSVSPKKNKNPGPGQYDLQHSDNTRMKTSQKFSVGTGKRADISSSPSAKVPGPGNYKISLANKTASPMFGFGSSGRQVINST